MDPAFPDVLGHDDTVALYWPTDGAITVGELDAPAGVVRFAELAHPIVAGIDPQGRPLLLDALVLPVADLDAFPALGRPPVENPTENGGKLAEGRGQ